MSVSRKIMDQLSLTVFSVVIASHGKKGLILQVQAKTKIKGYAALEFFLQQVGRVAFSAS